MMLKPSYIQCLEVLRVIDGDTVLARVQVGFNISAEVKLRMLGINAPELKTVEGQAAYVWTKSYFATFGYKGTCQSFKVEHPIAADKYGDRWDATLFIDGQDVSYNDAIVAAGHAVKRNYKVADNKVSYP